MENQFYSASTGGFYTSEIHGDNIPADAVEITEQQWKDLLDGQSNGKVIMPDANGYPTLQDPPPPPVQAPISLPEKLSAMGIDVAELRALLNSTTLEGNS